MLRTDGRDTGLALTPAVQIGQLQADGTQAVREDTGQWLITHIPSGRSLGNRAFGNLETARVLADQGDRLFVADSYGQRYEINRSEVRVPEETDFRLGRIAMPLDPAHHTTATCRRCGAAAAESIGQGSWYRMDYLTFCPTCAGAFAEQEGYEMPAAVGSLSGWVATGASAR